MRLRQRYIETLFSLQKLRCLGQKWLYLHYDLLDEQSKLVLHLQLYLRASDILLS